MARPRKVKTPKELLKLALEYKEEHGIYENNKYDKNNELLYVEYVYNILQYKGFLLWLEVNRDYLYQLNKEFSSTIKRIDDIFEAHNAEGIARGDIAQSFGIFYFKNKYGYTDKVENTNNNTSTVTIINNDDAEVETWDIE